LVYHAMLNTGIGDEAVIQLILTLLRQTQSSPRAC
jgi:hypothetical protein